MNRTEIFAKLGEIAQESSAEEIEWSSVTDATRVEELGFDSLTILDLLFEMEEAFEVEIKPKELLAIDTVGGLADFIQTKLAG